MPYDATQGIAIIVGILVGIGVELIVSLPDIYSTAIGMVVGVVSALVTLELLRRYQSQDIPLEN